MTQVNTHCFNPSQTGQ